MSILDKDNMSKSKYLGIRFLDFGKFFYVKSIIYKVVSLKIIFISKSALIRL